MVKARFSTRRGRPRMCKTGPDTGTPEFRAKYDAGLTQQAIDMCYARGYITESELHCAMHFRWLYSLRFGCPSLQALDIAKTRHGPLREEEAESTWRAARQREYREAAQMLEAEGTLVAILRIAVFDDTHSVMSAARSAQECRLRLRQGLASLRRLWQGQRIKPG